jgi:hypothetical protein
MSKNRLSEIEVQMFWKSVTAMRRARNRREVRFAESELEVMAMHTENPALRERCIAALNRVQIAA